MMNLSRRNFLKGAAAAGVGSIIPLSMVTVEAQAGDSFTFAWITDQHLQHISGTKFVKSFDDGFKLAISEVMNANPKPDFCYFGGDLAQAGLRSELDHGLDMWSKTGMKVHAINGEHDYYLDMGKSTRAAYGAAMPADNYRFEHKGVQFLALTTIRAAEDWEKRHAKDPQNRNKQMMRIDNYIDGSPFRLGREGLAWLNREVARMDKNKHTIVLSHSPVQKIYSTWNFWTEDAEQIQAALKDFKRVTVLYNHVHQPFGSQKGNISFLSNFSTAWPWPHPSTLAKDTMCFNERYKGCGPGPDWIPNLILPYHRADVANFRDATGWSLVNTNTGGKLDAEIIQWGEQPKRKVTWDKQLKDVNPQPAAISQTHY